jgi:hypothetical protein
MNLNPAVGRLRPVTAFATAIDVLFADPNLACDAVYRGVVPYRVGEFGDTRLFSETMVFDIRASEFAAPGGR